MTAAEKRRIRVARVATNTAAAVAVAVGTLAFIGWVTGAIILTRIHPSAVSMKMNTAIGSVLAGLAIFLHSRGKARRWALSLAATTGAIGLATLLEHSTNADLGIDQLFVMETFDGMLSPGRMTTSAALNLTLFGASFWIDSRPGKRFALLAQLSALVMLLSSFFNLAGYMYGAQSLHLTYTFMALPTALACLALGVGLLASRPERGLLAMVIADDAGGILARRTLTASVAVPLLLGSCVLWASDVAAFDLRFGLAIFATSNVSLFLGLVAWAATLLRKHDIHRRAAEEALRVANERLESRVQERTRALAAANRSLVEKDAERTRMIEALTAGEERYRSLARSLPNAATLVYDHDLRFVMADGELLKQLKLEPKDVVGKTLNELVTSKNAEAVDKAYRGALHGVSSIVDLEARQHTFRLHVGPVYDGAGALTGGLVFFYDITVTKQAEAVLQESEARMRGLAEAAFEGIALIDGDKLIEANSALCEMFGRSRDALVGQPFPELIDWLDRPAILEHIERGTADAREATGVRADGGTFPIAVRARRMAWGDRTLLALAIQDLTAGRQAEAAAREATTLWRGILDSADYSIIASNTEGVITEFNPAAERLLGYDAAEVVGVESIEMFHDSTEVAARAKSVGNELQIPLSPGFEVLVAKARRGITDQNEWSYVRKDGARVPVLLSVSALRDPSGAVYGFLAIGSDIREQRRTERELIKARDAAERAMRVRSDFLARMSHEIRTPLNGILGMIDLALLTPMTDEQREYLETTQASARNLLAIINDILDFSKIDSGKLRLEQIAFRPRSAFGSAVRVLGPLAQGKGIAILLDVAKDVPDGLIGDPQRINQVLTNLVANAIKFTDRGEVAVSVTVVEPGRSRVGLQVKVRDTGIGIPPEKQRMIFEAFSQGDEATTRRYGGTGLGLAISAQLIELMGGRIWVQSALGQGSEFAFSVPLDVDAAAEAAATPHALLRGMRALVVDDHAGQAALVKSLLEGWRMEATLAKRTDAVAIARTAHEAGTPFALLAIEHGLLQPESDALLAELKSYGGKDLLVVSLGAGSPAQAAIADRVFGLHGTVPTPVLASSLLETIEALATGRRGAGAADDGTREVTAVHDVVGLSAEILVAEDNAINRKVVRGMLERAGHRVETVENGREALAAIARRRFDLVLMDVEMPVMDGLEATRTLRALGGPRLPIVALTAQAMKGDKDRCLQAGMDAYLTKPIDRIDLLRLISRLLNGEGVPIATEDPVSAPVHVSSSSSPRPAAFDRAELLNRLGGDEELCADVISLFLKDAPQLLAELKAAFDADAAPPVERAAHKLRGVLLNLGARPSAARAESIELRARAQELAAAGTALVALEAELADLTSALQTGGPRVSGNSM
jgi:PAS domain S-box-containing protein